MSTGSILVVLRVPFLDRIESLTCLVEHLAAAGHHVTVVCPVEERFSTPVFSAPGVRLVPVETAAGRGPRVPTTARLFAAALLESFRVRADCVLSGDQLAGIVGAAVARLRGVPHAHYTLEFPEPRGGRRSLVNRLERAAIRRAALAVTFDAEHAAFLATETGIAPERIMLLPNSSGPVSRSRAGSNHLAAAFGFPTGSVVVLHSGGFGPWFGCRELAAAAAGWPESWRLVFHVSHDVSADAYLIGCRGLIDGAKVVLDAQPLASRDLDGLVASASVGVALYSIELLGFRARLMGLASGKIGRCLKNGIPVVAQNVPSIRRYLESYGCGVCVDSAAQVEAAVLRILADYGTYRLNALRCYDEIWAPGRFLEPIAARFGEWCRG